MFCIKCGIRLFYAAGFCHNCGSPVISPPNPPVSPRPANFQPPFSGNPPIPPSNYPYSIPPDSGKPLPYNQILVPPSYFPPSPWYPVQPTFTPPAFPDYQNPGHTLLAGAIGLPGLLWKKPNFYYSFLNFEGKVIVARRAGFWQRLGAYLIDSLILMVPALIFYLVHFLSLDHPFSFSGGRLIQEFTLPYWAAFLNLLINYSYFFFLLGKTGRSPGKKLVNLKVIRLDGQNPDWLTAGLRVFLGFPLSGGVLLLGYLWAGWDSQKQAWHDKLARTLVIENKVFEEGRDFFLPRSGFTSGQNF